ILVSSAIVLALSISGTFLYALKLTVITRVTVYASTCVALLVLRRQKNVPVAAFVLPGGNIVSILSGLLCIFLLTRSGWREARDVGLAVIAGMILFALSRLNFRRADRTITD
ncbi:MAG TPA: APC family permease, partial [Blastocatellia bacterium]|nr:APC family permease [Blastocatellia bacterium]